MAGFAMLIDSNIVYKFNIINFIDFYIKFMRMYLILLSIVKSFMACYVSIFLPNKINGILFTI